MEVLGGQACYPGQSHGMVSFYLCGVSSMAGVQAVCESPKCFAFLFGTEGELILAAALLNINTSSPECV